ncbi:hypothetical protein E3N86_00050 [Cryobacterium sp. Hz7]|uniref:hypothetical protein n=1 Tax=Cryobacterium sp. Hz7 TaxID=1259166 RepID=UPI00106BBCB6|nr:hypothetical protein [Cryobacterium sp. Hz7]TFB67201.1 hypothetical protein E3N86_00050 [Cryobacterium sp. Hz7]
MTQKPNPLPTVQIDLLAGVLQSKVNHGWKPSEVTQQKCVALLDHATTPLRALYLSALLNKSTFCAHCGGSSRIRKTTNVWDIQIWCDTPDCPLRNASSHNGELKPNGAPTHDSVATLPIWEDRRRRGLLNPGPDYEPPTADCARGTCAGHKHTNYRSNPTLPQVIAGADDDTPRLLLTDYHGDLNTIYGTTENNYTIAHVTVRRIVDAVDAACSAIFPHLATMSSTDRALFSLATTALWMRTPWEDFETLLDTPHVRVLLPANMVAEAESMSATWRIDAAA